MLKGKSRGATALLGLLFALGVVLASFPAHAQETDPEKANSEEAVAAATDSSADQADRPGRRARRRSAPQVRERARPARSRASIRPVPLSKTLCDVEGLWGYAAFEARLDADALKKLKPICQTAYDARKEVLATKAEDILAQHQQLRDIAAKMLADAKATLGDNAEKLEGWIDAMTAKLTAPTIQAGARRARAPRASVDTAAPKQEKQTSDEAPNEVSNEDAKKEK